MKQTIKMRYLIGPIILMMCVASIWSMFISSSSSVDDESIVCERGITSRQSPLYITPHFEGFATEPPHKIANALNHLEPESGGVIRAGYTNLIYPYALFKKVSGRYVLDASGFDEQLKQAATLNKPFVAYVALNHFMPAHEIPLAKELANDSNNLMKFRDGSSPDEQYFESSIIPFRLTNDPELLLVDYRNQALAVIAQKLSAFNEQHPDLLIGIMLNGETHYLFSDFFNGTGNFSSPRFTDYHPDELALFQEWLPKDMNAQSILDVPMNRYEWGKLSISGWIHPLEVTDTIQVYVNGQYVGNAQQDINRMDVYQHHKEKNRSFDEPNSGFLYEYDYRHLSPGRYYLEVMHTRNGNPRIIGSRWFDVSKTDVAYQDNIFPGAIERPQLSWGVKGYIDLPSDDAQLHYEPIAEKWLQFRSDRVKSYVESLATPFERAGFSSDKLYSYQLTPWLNGNWNFNLFGIDKEFFITKRMRPGITMYGGNMNNTHIFQMLAGHGGYGVPEMHPQSTFTAEYLQNTLHQHYCRGATFVSPYFMKLSTDDAPPSEHGRMNIAPDNTLWGSDVFYDALRELLSH